jgi:ribonuclease HII
MPSFSHEKRQSGIVAGIDEVGRGPLAGPVVAAAAIIDRERAPRSLLKLIDDSKKLTEAHRETAYQAMVASGCVTWAVAEASVAEIDAINILQATFLAMRRAFGALALRPHCVLVDGNKAPPGIACAAECIVGGDGVSYSIAAASILAKVTRDRQMARLAEQFPGYGWESNRGYGSADHFEALRQLGPTPHHRMSFSPFGRLPGL